MFGDQLADAGDPRGELIAIEQRLAARDDDDGADIDDETRALWKRRHALVEANQARWLGDEVAAALALPGRELGRVLTWRYGYLERLSLWFSYETDKESFEQARARMTRQVGALLDCDAARFLRSFACSVSEQGHIDDLVQVIARTPRAVTALELSCWAREVDQPAVGTARCDALAHALPALRQLKLHGARMLQTLRHAALETLQLDRADALDGLLEDNNDIARDDAPELPALSHLDLALRNSPYYTPVDATQPPRLVTLLCNPAMPALRSIDLSRNDDCSEPLYQPELLAALAERRPETLLLPTPLGEHAADALRAQAGALSRIAKLSMPRLYTHASAVSEDALREMLPALQIEAVLPHRPSWAVRGREVLEVNSGDKSECVWVGFASLMELIEEHWPALGAPQRAAVDGLIAAYEEIDYYDEGDGRPLRAELRRAPLRAAFEAMGLDDEAAPYWLNGRIVEMYKVLCDERHDTIDIEKVWGW
ncbi:MAG: hypothetical protein KC503_46020 [Myxococcales bacterium]|nr:hypothetical protein [Myxococcales bacterium]